MIFSLHKINVIAMYILAFELASFLCSIALCKDNEVLEFIEYDNIQGQSSSLIPEINTILTKNNLSFHELSIIATTNGPGSFTGIRIALSTIKGMQIASNVLSASIPSAELAVYKYLQTNPNNQKKILVVLESKRLELYTRLFDNLGTPIAQYQTLSPEEIYEIYKNKSIVLLGNGTKYLEQYNVCTTLQIIDAKDIVKFARNIKNFNLYPCEPIYARNADVHKK